MTGAVYVAKDLCAMIWVSRAEVMQVCNFLMYGGASNRQDVSKQSNVNLSMFSASCITCT